MNDNKCKISDTTLNVIYSNIDSISNKMYEIGLLIYSHVNNFDMLFFTEVNVKNITSSYEESEFSFNNYNLYSVNFMKQGFRGIIGYIKSNFIVLHN